MSKIDCICIGVIAVLAAVALCAAHDEKPTISEEVPPTQEIHVPTPVIPMKVTAYCICRRCCGEFADGKTSIGDDATICDGVAADPKLLPYRTLLRIPGLTRIREVDDTGEAMKKSALSGIYHIDVRMPSHEEALRWGVKYLSVEILN